MNKTKLIILFLITNFLALAIGGLFTNSGVTGDWYANLQKAPWTPPGWFFGVAWTTIMICYSIYMAHLFYKEDNHYSLYFTYILQWALNVSWNPAFFYYHKMFLALLLIASLLFVIGIQLFSYFKKYKSYSLLILPYFLWLMVAFSLNAYAFYKN